MTDQEAERVIAEWLGVRPDNGLWEEGKLSIDPCGIPVLCILDDQAMETWVDWSPSTDANLWPEILERVGDECLDGAYLSALVLRVGVAEKVGEVGFSLWWTDIMCVLRASLPDRTHALAVAIKEVSDA